MASKNVAEVFKDKDVKEVAAATSFTQKRLKQIINDGDDMTPREAVELAQYAKVDAVELLNYQTERSLQALNYKAPDPEKTTVSTAPRSGQGSARASKPNANVQF